MGKLSDETSKEMEKFETKGFVRSSSSILSKLRYDSRLFKIFRPGGVVRPGRKGSSKYTPFDILGDYKVYYYDVEKKEKFVEFLVKKFYTKNPEPDLGLRKVFTQILHSNGLHWSGCCCGKRNLAKKKILL